ncbi:MAG TPA: hypothetical protein VF589_02730 [Allosphingosinicella sp.]
MPGRTRRDGWSPERQQAFILRLALCGCVNASARAVEMQARGAHKLRERPGGESFAAAWDKAFEWGRESRIDHSIERALAGEIRSHHYRGRVCGEDIRFGDGLSMAVLNALKPVYRDTDDKRFLRRR